MPRTTIRSEDITDLQVKTGDVAAGGITTTKMAVDPTNASNLSSGSVPLAQLGNAPETNVSGLQNDIATLALQQATQNNQSAYNLANAFVDQYEDSSGIDVETDTVRNSAEYVWAATQVTDSNCILLFPMDSTDTTLPLDSATSDNWQIKSVDDGTYSSSNGSFSGLGYLAPGAINTDGGFLIDRNSTTIAGLNFGTGAFTVETWVKHNGVTTPNGAHVYFHDLTSNGNDRAAIAIGGNIDDYGGSFMSSGGTLIRAALTAAGFRHVAYIRDASANTAIFFNGNRMYSGSNAVATDYSATDLLALCMRHSSVNSGNAYLSQVRFSDIARYDPTQTTLTVPTAAWAATVIGASATGNYTSTTETAAATVSKMGIVVLYKNESGTATLSTDLVAEVSANGGTNWTAAPLTAGGTFSTGILIAKSNDITITNTGTAPKFRISFANQSAGVKETRVYGVSLQY